MKRAIIALSFLLSSTLSAKPFGMAWLQTFGRIYKERFAIPKEENTLFNPVVKHLLSASACTIIKLTKLPESIEQSISFPKELASHIIDISIPEIYGKIADTLAPALKEKDQLAGTPIGVQRFAKMSSAAHKEHESKFLQTIVSFGMHFAISSITSSLVQKAKKRMGIDKSPWEHPFDYLYNQIIFGTTKKCGVALDHWLRRVPEKEVAQKLECSTCAQDIISVVPSNNSPEGKSWSKTHLCKEEWGKIAENTSGRCEKHSI